MTLKLDFCELPAFPVDPTDQIWKYQDQLIEIRGFWYAIPNESGAFLSSQPHLKSCCVGNPRLIHQQIRIYDGLPHLKDDRAVSLQGFFKIDPQIDSDGQLIQLYILHDAHEVYKTSNIGWISAFVLLAGVIFFLKKSLLGLK